MGPGNTFSVNKTLPDFYLDNFAMTPDGKVLALGWESGPIELWELQPRRPLPRHHR